MWVNISHRWICLLLSLGVLFIYFSYTHTLGYLAIPPWGCCPLRPPDTTLPPRSHQQSRVALRSIESIYPPLSPPFLPSAPVPPFLTGSIVQPLFPPRDPAASGANGLAKAQFAPGGGREISSYLTAMISASCFLPLLVASAAVSDPRYLVRVPGELPILPLVSFHGKIRMRSFFLRGGGMFQRSLPCPAQPASTPSTDRQIPPGCSVLRTPRCLFAPGGGERGIRM